ncbi:MAG: Cysteine-rich repeat protein [Parcubacteria group bacterium GW2011_GWC2_49_9]|nr:MAG: Cysteine-rich repeat protein [Parcubacteria group bacterium GW2011_GWC2_49_9]
MSVIRRINRHINLGVMMITIVVLAGIGLFVASNSTTASGAGAIWTTTGSCGDPQNINHYAIGDHVFINGANFAAEEYNWDITGQPSANPTGEVAFGTQTIDGSGAFCFDAYTIGNDNGVYKVNFDNKNDNYSVTGDVQEPFDPSCGDDVVNQESEECDGSAPDHYQCADDCTLEYIPYCGDEEVNQESEQCDWNDPQVCRTEDGYAGTQSCDMGDQSESKCTWNSCEPTEFCGDGKVNGSEQCDDGNADIGDGCSAICAIEPICTGSGTYTVDAEFDEGSLINVVHTPSDQLQLSDQVNAFNFIWVAVSTKGTVVKINTDSGAIEGEYKTSPASHGNGDPSRTTVDKDGSVWLSNRSNVFEGAGSIIHIGLVENGQCEDRNGNGVIDTSSAQDDIGAWADASGDRNVSTADDECIVHYVKMSNSSGTRHISVDASNNIWVAGLYSRNFDLVKGGKWNVPNSGTIIRSESSVGYGGYGGLIDKNGVIWSARSLLRWDTANPLTGPNGGNWTGYSHDSYGLCIDSQGNVWDTSLSGDQIRKFNSSGVLQGTFGHGNYYAQGCVVDTRFLALKTLLVIS